jgi:SAM-dependent methyltransferase
MRSAVLVGALFALAGLACHGQGSSANPSPPLDVPFVPTPSDAVAAMLKLAGVTKGDVVYDLGSGDGRIVIAAARRYGARAVGIDIDPARVAEGERNARAAGVADRVQFRQGDLFDADIRAATVVTLYLLPRVNQRLRPKLLAELRPGTRVVSYGFDMGDWLPERSVEVGSSTVYLWVVPPPKE